MVAHCFGGLRLVSWLAVRFIYQYPDTHGIECDMLDAGPVTELARSAEECGWDGFAFTEHPVPGARWLAAGGHQTLDPFAALAHVAAVTTGLRLLTYLAVAPYRNPFLLAKAATTVDRLSNGRFVLGVGTGYLKSEFRALGVEFDERNELFDETLDALPLHWSGEPFSSRGRHFDARDSIARPRPAQSPIPVWIGGNSRLTLRRVAERAQGWMPLTSPVDISSTTRTPHITGVDGLARSIGILRDLAGPRFTEIEVVPAFNEPWDPNGDAGRAAETFAALAAAGATSIVVATGPKTYPDTVRFLETFARAFF